MPLLSLQSGKTFLELLEIFALGTPRVLCMFQVRASFSGKRHNRCGNPPPSVFYTLRMSRLCWSMSCRLAHGEETSIFSLVGSSVKLGASGERSHQTRAERATEDLRWRLKCSSISSTALLNNPEAEAPAYPSVQMLMFKKK